MADKIYTGSLGLAIYLATYEDAIGPVPKILYKKPDGTTGSWNATEVDIDGDQHIRYITQSATDLDISGVYHFQADLDLEGYDLPGNTASLIVYDRFK